MLFLIEIPSFRCIRKYHNINPDLPFYNEIIEAECSVPGERPDVVFREKKRGLEWKVFYEDLSTFQDLLCDLEEMAKVAAKISFVLLANPEEPEVSFVLQGLRSEWHNVREMVHEDRKRLRSYRDSHREHSDFVYQGEAAPLSQHLLSTASSFDVLLYIAVQIGRSMSQGGLASAFLELAELLQLFLGLTSLTRDFARYILEEENYFFVHLPEGWNAMMAITKATAERFLLASNHLAEIRFYAHLKLPFQNPFSTFLLSRGLCPSQLFSTPSGSLPVFPIDIPLTLVLPGPPRGLFALQNLGFFSTSPIASFLLVDYHARIAFFFTRATLPRLRNVLDALVQFAQRFLGGSERRINLSRYGWRDLILLLRRETPLFDITLNKSHSPYLNAQPSTFISWRSMVAGFEQTHLLATLQDPLTAPVFEHLSHFLDLWLHFSSLLALADGALTSMTPEALAWPKGRASSTLFYHGETLSLQPHFDLPRNLSETVGQKDFNLQGLHGGMRNLITKRGSVPVLGLPPLLKLAGHLLLDYLIAASGERHSRPPRTEMATRTAIDSEIDKLFREHRDVLPHDAKAKARHVLEPLFSLSFLDYPHTLELGVD